MTAVSTKSNEVSPLFSLLLDKITGDIDCSYEKLSKHSKDFSSIRIWPQAIIYPKSTSDIKESIFFASEYKLPLSLRGGGTCASGGSLTEGIQLDLTRYFDKVTTIDVLGNKVTVDAGVIVQDLKNKLDAWNLEIPLLCDTNAHASIGGLLAGREVSDSSLIHGSIYDWVESITVILDNGEEHKLENGITPSGRLLEIYEKIFPLLSKNEEIIRVARPQVPFNTSGYDLWGHSIGPRKLIDLIVGSQGTLCVITSATLRLVPKKKYSSSIVCTLPTYELATTVVDILNHHNAEKVVCFDETVFKLAQKYKTYLTEKLITSETTALTLIATFSDTSEHALKQKENALLKVLPVPLEAKKIIDEYEYENYTLIAHSGQELLEKYGGKGFIPLLITDDVIVPIHTLSPFLEEVNNLISNRGIIYTISGNIGYGQIAIVPLINAEELTKTDSVFFLAKEIFLLVKKYKGSMSGTKNDGVVRTPYLPLMYGTQIIELFKEVKKIFDPSGILNPGKKTTVDLNYLKQNINRGSQ